MEYIIYILGLSTAGYFLSLYRNKNKLPDSIPSLKILKSQIHNLREKKHNFLLRNNEEFFNTLFDYSLTDEQIEVAINDSNSSLVIASAGSGKTSTLIGKYLYLVKRCKIPAEKVLVLAFNKKIQKEVKRKIEKYGIDGEVKTFHRLGKEILESNKGYKLSLGKIAEEDEEGFLVTENIEKCIKEAAKVDASIYQNIVEFKALCPYQRIESFAKNQDEYNSAISSYPFKRIKHRIGEQTRPLRIPALQKDVYVASQEELTIANFLYMNSIEFSYEAEFPGDYPYKPDFYYPEIDLWHEHFALDELGNAPEAFEGYEAEVRLKKSIHEKSKQQFIYTYSWQVTKGEILDSLTDNLKKFGLKLKKRSTDEIETRIKEIYNDSTYSLIRNIIKMQKGGPLKLNETFNALDSLSDQFRAQKFKAIYFPIFKAYQKILKDNNDIDFEDMINLAADIIKNNHPKEFHSSTYGNYKWILIDEFQDTSYCRGYFLKALRGGGHFGGAKICAVGDDWQSIYRFAGSDLSQVYDFEKQYVLPNSIFVDDPENPEKKIKLLLNEDGVNKKTLRMNYYQMIMNASKNGLNFLKIPDKETKSFFITKNHRSDKSLVDIASAFIQVNPNQIKKNVKTLNLLKKNQQNQVINFCECDNYSDKEIEKIIKKIPINSHVYIMGRNGFHLEQTQIKLLVNKYPQYVIEETTIHKSKGLEADYIIILGLEEGLKGFPRKMDDDPLIKIFQPKDDQFPDAEERRVMYVAMTRAKYGIYMCYKPTSSSEFIKEINDIAEVNNIYVNYFNFSTVTKECPECRKKGRKGTLTPQTNHHQVANRGKDATIFLSCNFYRKHQDSLTCEYTEDIVHCYKCKENGEISNLETKRIDNEWFVRCQSEKCNLIIPFFEFRETIKERKLK